MASPNCAACGSDLRDPEARFCSGCGAPVPDAGLAGERDSALASDEAAGDDPVDEAGVSEGSDSGSGVESPSIGLSSFSLEVPPRLRPSEEHWQYATWGAVAVGAVAIVALLAVVLSLVSSSDEASPPPPAAASESTTTTVRSWIGVVTEFPVTDPSTIESPRIGDSAGYFQDGAFIAVRLSVDACERSDGMLRASGSIRNETNIGQTLDYHIAVEMTRRLVGTSLASMEATVEDLGPRETAEWAVETVSTKTVNVACDVAALTVVPSESS